jgi:hypothetical protein
MKKVRKSHFLGVFGVLTAVLFLAGIGLMQAQVSTKGKPVKPPEANWSVLIPTTGNTMMFGDGADYINGSGNIAVTVEKNSPGTLRQYYDFVTRIVFKISTPTTRWVNFEEISLQKLYEGDYPSIDPDYGKPCCVFPPPYNYCAACICDNCEPLCMQDFMNGAFHPVEDYASFFIELQAFDKDILTMAVDESYKLGTSGHDHDFIVMTLAYQTGSREPTYHNIECSKSAHLGEGSLHAFNIWITRTAQDAWTVDVGIDGETKQIVDQFLFVEEFYYETSQKGKKTATAWYSTLFAGGNLHFSLNLRKL